MVALGTLNPIEEARAKLQDQIGLFLSGRAKLMRLMNHPSLQIQGQAQGLYAIQTALETRLQNEIMPKIQSVSSGTWNMSDIITIGGFTTSLMRQINDVNNLERAGGGVAVSTGMDTQTVMVVIPLLVIVSMVGGYLLTK